MIATKNRLVVADFLLKTFPKAFSPENPKPLKIGIHKDILEHNLTMDGTLLSSEAIREALGWYCRRYPYLKATSRDNAQRIDLNGQAVGAVAENEKTSALLWLSKRKAKDIKPSTDSTPATTPITSEPASPVARPILSIKKTTTESTPDHQKVTVIVKRKRLAST